MNWRESAHMYFHILKKYLVYTFGDMASYMLIDIGVISVSFY